MRQVSRVDPVRIQADKQGDGQLPAWWLRVTSAWDHPQKTREQRAQGRRSRLASWFILGLLVIDLVLLPIGINAPGTLVALFVAGFGLLLAAALNRHGLVAGAGIIIIILTCGGVLGSLLSEPTGLTLDSLPGYDLLAIAIIVAASVLPRKSAFFVAAVNIGLIVGDFALQPHAGDLQHELQFYGDPATGALALLVRPVALQIILAFAAYLWVRGMETEIARADRAEEVAALEHAAALQRSQLEEGVQQMVEVLTQAANGQANRRIPRLHQEQLWIIGSAINTLLSRLQRAHQAEYTLQQTEQEIHRLAAAIQAAQAGHGTHWPAPSGTPLDQIIELLPRPRPFPPSPPPSTLSPPSSTQDLPWLGSVLHYQSRKPEPEER